MIKTTPKTPDPLSDYPHFERDDSMGKKIAHIFSRSTIAYAIRDAWHAFFTMNMRFPFEAMVEQPIKKSSGSGSTTTLSRSTIYELVPIERSNAGNVVLIGAVSHYQNISFHIFMKDIREVYKANANLDQIILHRYWLHFHTHPATL